MKSSVQAEPRGSAASKSALRVDRYLALAACAGAGGAMASDAAGSLVYSDPAWSATLSTATGPIGSISTFGAGATAINDIRFSVRDGVVAQWLRFYGQPSNAFGWQFNAFNAGDEIGPSVPTASLQTNFFLAQSFLAGTQWAPVGSVNWAEVGGPSGGSVRAFLGFRVGGDSSRFYGYFDLEVFRTGTGAGSHLGLTLHGWAYNSTAGEAITIGGVTPIPGGTGLVALAIGAAGLRGRRRSRN